MSSITQTSVAQTYSLQSTTTQVDVSKIKEKEIKKEKEDEEEKMWQAIQKVAAPILQRNFKDLVQDGITKKLLEDLYEKSSEIRQLDLAELDLTCDHLEVISSLFPHLIKINVKNARLDNHLIFHEMEIASYFKNPQLVTVQGLAYIPYRVRTCF